MFTVIHHASNVRTCPLLPINRCSLRLRVTPTGTMSLYVPPTLPPPSNCSRPSLPNRQAERWSFRDDCNGRLRDVCGSDTLGGRGSSIGIRRTRQLRPSGTLLLEHSFWPVFLDSVRVWGGEGISTATPVLLRGADRTGDLKRRRRTRCILVIDGNGVLIVIAFDICSAKGSQLSSVGR